ncbi:MAG TPA: hypothetical protein VFC02_25385 [Anaerolineales bacterium]|nr:hypothetical protein [Anaerolineales bacterium]
MTRSTLFALLLAGLLVACAAPAPTSAPAPTTQPEPTQPAPVSTSVPVIPGEQVVIPSGEGNEMISATVTGNGEVSVILANTSGYDSLKWLPLIDVLKNNENLRMITFAYRNEDGTTVEDTHAVIDYLRAEGIEKIICIGGGTYGTNACAAMKAEPEIIGMVLFPSFNISAIEATFPKLFLTGETDPIADAVSLKRTYDQSAEPKAFKSYAADRHAAGLFTHPTVGPQLLADITDFINEVISSQ